jgi:hypothetical protein
LGFREPHGQAEAASQKKIVTIEGEKAAKHTTARQMPGDVIFQHRYHPLPDGKESIL